MPASLARLTPRMIFVYLLLGVFFGLGLTFWILGYESMVSGVKFLANARTQHRELLSVIWLFAALVSAGFGTVILQLCAIMVWTAQASDPGPPLGSRGADEASEA